MHSARVGWLEQAGWFEQAESVECLDDFERVENVQVTKGEVDKSYRHCGREIHRLPLRSGDVQRYLGRSHQGLEGNRGPNPGARADLSTPTVVFSLQEDICYPFLCSDLRKTRPHFECGILVDHYWGTGACICQEGHTYTATHWEGSEPSRSRQYHS